MNSLIKIAVLCSGLVLAGCPSSEEDITKDSLIIDGKDCITMRDINVYGTIVSGSVHDKLLSNLGFDPGVDGINVYISKNDIESTYIIVTDGSSCLLFLGSLSKTELSRMLGIKTFDSGIDRKGDKR